MTAVSFTMEEELFAKYISVTGDGLPVIHCADILSTEYVNR